MGDQEIVQTIEDAFADVPYPGNDLLVYSMLNSEALQYRADFVGKHWREVIDPDFLQLHNVLLMFSQEGLRFYLPAYLIGAIRYPANSPDWIDACSRVLYPMWDWPWPPDVK